MKNYLLLLSVVGVLHAAFGEVGYWKTEKSRTWPFLRGNVEFTLRHPLHIFHGRFEKMSGSVSLDPEDASKGLLLHLEGNTKGVTFQEAQGDRVKQWIGNGAPWKLDSFVIIPRGAGGEDGIRQIEFILNVSYAGRSSIEKLPAACQNDMQVLKCRFESNFLAHKYGIPLPKLFAIASNEEISARGEFVFGEKEEAK